MMKKIYIKPNNKVFLLNVRTIIAGSITGDSTPSGSMDDKGKKDDEGESRSVGGSSNVWSNEW